MVGNWVAQLIWIYTLFYFFLIGCDWYASCYFSKTDKQYNLIIYSIITLVYMFFIPTIITMCQKICRSYYRKLERLKESGTLIRSGLALLYWFVVLQSLKKNTHLTNVLSGKQDIWSKYMDQDANTLIEVSLKDMKQCKKLFIKVYIFI